MVLVLLRRFPSGQTGDMHDVEAAADAGVHTVKETLPVVHRCCCELGACARLCFNKGGTGCGGIERQFRAMLKPLRRDWHVKREHIAAVHREIPIHLQRAATNTAVAALLEAVLTTGVRHRHLLLTRLAHPAGVTLTRVEDAVPLVVPEVAVVFAGQAVTVFAGPPLGTHTCLAVRPTLAVDTACPATHLAVTVSTAPAVLTNTAPHECACAVAAAAARTSDVVARLTPIPRHTHTRQILWTTERVLRAICLAPPLRTRWSSPTSVTFTFTTLTDTIVITFTARGGVQRTQYELAILSLPTGTTEACRNISSCCIVLASAVATAVRRWAASLIALRAIVAGLTHTLTALTNAVQTTSSYTCHFLTGDATKTRAAIARPMHT